MFDKRLKEYMSKNDISQVWLADCTGIDPSHISHYCCGRRVPTLENLQKILRCICQDAEDVQHLVIGD